MTIQENIRNIIAELPPHVRLVAVSKFHTNEAIEAAYKEGQRIFGESKVQELNAKYTVLPKDIEWHFIGHLQTNKVKYIVPFIAMIHAVDSFKLLKEINRHAAKINRVIPCLLEIHIAKEESKFGFTFESCREMLRQGEWKELNNICISGIMGMATNTDDETEIKTEFRHLKLFFDELKNNYFPQTESFREISMGMSHDYRLAIEEGSTLIRVGSKIFGERTY